MDYNFSFLLFFSGSCQPKKSLFNDSGQFFGSWHQSLLRKLLTKYNLTDFKNQLFQMSPVSRSIGEHLRCMQTMPELCYLSPQWSIWRDTRHGRREEQSLERSGISHHIQQLRHKYIKHVWSNLAEYGHALGSSFFSEKTSSSPVVGYPMLEKVIEYSSAKRTPALSSKWIRRKLGWYLHTKTHTIQILRPYKKYWRCETTNFPQKIIHDVQG